MYDDDDAAWLSFPSTEALIPPTPHTIHKQTNKNSATLAAYLSEVLAVFPIHSALAHHAAAAAAAGRRPHNDDDLAAAAWADEEEDGGSSGASLDAAKPVLPLSVYLRLEELRMGGGGGVWAVGDGEGDGEMAVQVRFGGIWCLSFWWSVYLLLRPGV